jgi:hypothetical protein
MEEPERAVEVMLQLARLGITLSLTTVPDIPRWCAAAVSGEEIKIDRLHCVHTQIMQGGGDRDHDLRTGTHTMHGRVAEGWRLAQLEKLMQSPTGRATCWPPLPADAAALILGIN